MLKQNPDLMTPKSNPSSPSGAQVDDHVWDLNLAFDFLEQIMHPESVRRIGPRDALYHAFLLPTSSVPSVASPSSSSIDDADDDAFFPHPFLEGVCRQAHHIDPVTDQACVNVKMKVPTSDGGVEEVVVMRHVAAGEGIAIGRDPCEFHKNDEW